MLLLVYRSIVTTLLAIVMVMMELAVARGVVAALAYFEHHRSVHLRGEPAHDWWRSRPRPTTRSSCSAVIRRPANTAKTGSGLLHDVPRDGARHPGFGTDDRGRDVLPALHPAAVLPDTRHSDGDRHGRHRRRGAHPGAGGRHRRQPSRRSGPQTQDADPGLAADRHRGRAVARAHPRRDHRAVT